MNEANMLEQIDRFIAGTLSSTEKESFKTALESNPQLDELYNKELIARASIREMIRKDYKNQISEWTASQYKTSSNFEKTKTRRLYTLIAIAASIAIFATVFFTLSPNANSQKIISTYAFEADDMRIRGTQEENVFDKALQEYYAGHYDAAIAQLEGLQNSETSSTQVNYYLAHAYLQSGRSAESATIFSDIISTPNLPAFMNRQKLEWNLLLAQAANGSVDDDWNLRLEQFMAENPSLRSKAEALRKKL